MCFDFVYAGLCACVCLYHVCVSMRIHVYRPKSYIMREQRVRLVSQDTYRSNIDVFKNYSTLLWSDDLRSC